MYVVIFKAKTKSLDQDYFSTAARMRQLALDEYQCIEFTSAEQDGFEIALSYWHSLDDIQRWKSNAEHLAAQVIGKKNWYSSYQVEVVEVLRRYEFEQ